MVGGNDGQPCLNLVAVPTALHRGDRMVRQVLHEHAAALSAAGRANRSRRLIKCAKDCGHYLVSFAAVGGITTAHVNLRLVTFSRRGLRLTPSQPGEADDAVRRVIAAARWTHPAA
jgi:hypothetical protein